MSFVNRISNSPLTPRLIILPEINVSKSTINFLRYIVILITLSTPIIRQKAAFTDNAQSRNITQLLPCQKYDKLMPNSSLVGTNLMVANDMQLNSYAMLFYHVKHSRFNPPSVPVKFKQRIHRLLIILVISGDISLNPGPVKNPCELCAKPVAKKILVAD